MSTVFRKKNCRSHWNPREIKDIRCTISEDGTNRNQEPSRPQSNASWDCEYRNLLHLIPLMVPMNFTFSPGKEIWKGFEYLAAEFLSVTSYSVRTQEICQEHCQITIRRPPNKKYRKGARPNCIQIHSKFLFSERSYILEPSMWYNVYKPAKQSFFSSLNPEQSCQLMRTEDNIWGFPQKSQIQLCNHL